MSNVLDKSKRTQMLGCLIEGMALRATARICGVAFNSVLKFVPAIGQACSEYQDRVLRNLTCNRLELDEQWNFVYAKDKNVPKELRGQFGYGSVWTWVAIDAETKLVPSYFVGDRSVGSAFMFVDDLRSRVVNRPQITTDGHSPYLAAIEASFGADADFAQLVKSFGNGPDGPETRYSPPVCTGITKRVISGNPDKELVSTSYVERLNLSLRMHNRRFTRLTNAHSKKAVNHAHALSLFFMYYNFAKIHQSLRITPAMEAGISNHVWELGEIVDLLDVSASGQAAA